MDLTGHKRDEVRLYMSNFLKCSGSLLFLLGSAVVTFCYFLWASLYTEHVYTCPEFKHDGHRRSRWLSSIVFIVIFVICHRLPYETLLFIEITGYWRMEIIEFVIFGSDLIQLKCNMASIRNRNIWLSLLCH